MKRKLLALLAVVMTVGSFATPAFATDEAAPSDPPAVEETINQTTDAPEGSDDIAGEDGTTEDGNDANDNGENSPSGDEVPPVVAEEPSEEQAADESVVEVPAPELQAAPAALEDDPLVLACVTQGDGDEILLQMIPQSQVDGLFNYYPFTDANGDPTCNPDEAGQDEVLTVNGGVLTAVVSHTGGDANSVDFAITTTDGTPVTTGTVGAVGEAITVSGLQPGDYILTWDDNPQGVPFTVEGEQSHKITICHATASFTNPYVKIKVDTNAADGIAGNSGQQPDHYGEHTGPLFNGADKGWGDIIPPLAGVHQGRNWTEAGQALYNNGCKPSQSPAPTVIIGNTKACGDDDIHIKLGNKQGTATAVFSVNIDGVVTQYEVPAGGSKTVTVKLPLDGTPVHIVVADEEGNILAEGDRQYEECPVPQTLTVSGVIECSVVDGKSVFTFDGTINNPNGLEIVSVSHQDGVVANAPFTFTVVYTDNLGKQKTATAEIAASEDCTPPPTKPVPGAVVDTSVECDATSTTATLTNTGTADAIFTYEIGENLPPIGTALAVVKVAPGQTVTITIPLTPGKATPVVISSAGMETVSVSINPEKCPVPTPVCGPGHPMWNGTNCTLPVTGSTTGNLLKLAGGLLFTGFILVFAFRRRQNHLVPLA